MKKYHQAFFVGSWVGLLQAFAGMTISMRFGPVVAFIASTLIYVVLYSLYKATLEPKEDADEQKQDQ